LTAREWRAAAGASFRVLAEASMLRPDTRVLITTANSSIVTVAQLVGKKIAVNGTNSIGTLLISVLLSDHGISPAKVRLITDPQGFPAMPAHLQEGAWAAAFLAEPYITFAGERYGDRILADLDQGSAVNFPIDGYVATTTWVQKYPKTGFGSWPWASWPPRCWPDGPASPCWTWCCSSSTPARSSSAPRARP
jgi:NitT/TauT family transport system substrate-binding protein